MDSHWVNQRPGYRCRHGRTSAKPPTSDQPKNLYVREDRLLDVAAVRLKRPDRDGTEQHLKTEHLVIVCGPGKIEIQLRAHDTRPSP